jgi:hypothetical protein
MNGSSTQTSFPAMKPRNSESPAARHRVMLPSGRTIEVLRFEQQATSEELHVCPTCARDLVQPRDWSQAGRGSWRVMLECPNCAWQEEAVVETEALERFDEALDAGTDLLRADLARLTQANMEEDVERFVRALRDGHIWPIDF